MPDARDKLLGWATDSLVELDPLAPGLIGRVLTASPKSRQAIFTVLASRLLVAEHNDALGRVDDGDDANLAFILREGRPREVLELIFGRVPDGWLGALERLGGQPMSNLNTYVKLHRLFADPMHRRRAEALQHVGQITEKMLAVLDTLDDRWVHAETLKRLHDVTAAKDFNRAIAFAQCVSSKATDAAVADAIARLAPTARLSGIVRRYVRRADRFPSHPLALDGEIRPLVSARDFIEAARRYHNCLATMIDRALIGLVAFAEFRDEAIVELRPLTMGRGWVLDGVHVARNAHVPTSLADEVERKCAAVGIPSFEQRDNSEDWRRYIRFVREGGWVG